MSHPRVILDSLAANARKSLSQNFLTSPHWADLLTRTVLEPEGIEEVWEIGPGLGALSAQLIQKTTLPIRVFEYDRKLAAYLRETYPRLEVIEGDFLEVDLPKISPAAKRVALLSNLPYHLSSPILFKLALERHRLATLVLTFQREFAERLLASPRTGEYGALTVMAKFFYRMKSLGILPGGAFYPPPAVSSQALQLTPLPPGDVDPELMGKVVHAAFAHRRKKMSNNLKEAFPERPIAEILASMGVSADARAEELSQEAFTDLARRLSP